MLCQELNHYLNTFKGLPFFYVVGDKDYNAVLNTLRDSNVSVVRMSGLCSSPDKFPDIDDLVDQFRISDVDNAKNKTVVVGLGEYLALRGDKFAKKELSRLKSVTLGNARVVLLLRGVAAQASEIIRGDNKITGQKRAYVSLDSRTNITVTNFPPDIGGVHECGIQALLKDLEDGVSGDCQVSTRLSLDNSIFPYCSLSDAYEVLVRLTGESSLERAMGTDEQWKQLLEDSFTCGRTIDSVFEKNRIGENLLQAQRLAPPSVGYVNWLKFLYLKLNANMIHNVYLKRVVRDSPCFEDYKINLTMKILEISPQDESFMKLYEDRKQLLKDFKEGDIAEFVHRNGIDSDECIYCLTDNTLLEKKMIVKWVAKKGMSEAICKTLGYIYPALCSYLKKYSFHLPKNPELADELTAYFDSYKRLKVSNRITDDFINRVEKVAEEHSYASLPTRENAISDIQNKENAHLYWIDALGVEYLSYITELAKNNGLSIHIDITRSDLPTITSVNKKFFDEWRGGRKDKEERLDEIKHKKKGGYFFTDDEDPIHIPAELEVIEEAIGKAVLALKGGKCQSFVIASDHGASRLAVINKQEVRYETNTKGEHSGRCCKFFEGCDLMNAIKDEETGYIVLTDYGRFRGSRAANVEVHGGASLEEIVVPVITLKKRKEDNPRVDLLFGNNIMADKREGVTLRLYISYVDSPDNVRLVLKDKMYPGLNDEKDNTRFSFLLNDIKRAGGYEAELFDGDNDLGKVSFTVKGRAAKINDKFDFGE